MGLAGSTTSSSVHNRHRTNHWASIILLYQTEFASTNLLNLWKKHFQKFHFYKTEYYDKICPIYNQPEDFLATAKIHKFNKMEDIIGTSL